MLKRLLLAIGYTVLVTGHAGCDPEGEGDVSDDSVFDDDVNDIEELPWPRDTTSLPPCNDNGAAFVLPELAPPAGDILLWTSALLQPVGTTERVEIEVYRAGSDELDEDALGELEFDAGPQATVLEVGMVDAGIAYADVVFDAPGVHELFAAFVDEADERTGSVEIMAFETQLPIWEMTISPDDLESIVDNPNIRKKVPATLTVEGDPYETKVRIHGGSSRSYPKKSFRFDLKGSATLPDTHDHLILRAEWNDKTMLRNYLGLEVIRDATWLHTPRAEMVHFRINGRYYGVMWRVERIGGDFLRTRGLDNETGSLYESDPAFECAIPGGNLTPLPSEAEYRCVYDQKKGDLDFQDLMDLIEGTLQLPEDELEAVINDTVNVNEMLVYWAVMAVIQNHDHIKKNYYLFREPHAEDDRWIIIPWDLELTFGHLWTEENDVLDERIFTDEPLTFGADGTFDNALFARLFGIEAYRNRFYEMVGYIVETTFTDEFIGERIDNALCRATPDILADENKRADNEEFFERVEEIHGFVDARRAFILDE